MYRRARVVAVAVTVVVSGLGVSGLPQASADKANETRHVMVAGDSDLSTWNREFVRLIAGSHPQELVRADAWVALVSEDGDAAVNEFVEIGLWDAVVRADDVDARNADFARRVLATFTREFSPEVHAAAQHAVNGGNSDRAEFVRVGFASAQDRDRRVRAAEGSQAAALVAEDRAFVRNLAVNDPGPQVRVAATWATRSGATDDDLVAFFADGWSHAATLDLEVHRRAEIESDARWRATVRRLLADAEQAEQAANEAAAEMREQARAAAARAWRAAGEGTTPARSAWADAEQVALRQAANWRAVAAAAAAASGPNWKAVATTAVRTQSAWATEQSWATEQARAWNALLAKAIDGETRMTKPAG